jgi:hypothetical protein
MQRRPGWAAFFVADVLAYGRASWFETRGFAALLTMRL